MTTNEYNPLDKANLGASVVAALMIRKPQSLDKLEKFDGAGIYALYYSGDSSAYKALSELNKGKLGAWPIYVGKADPQGARKGLSSGPTTALYKRLKDHRDSIVATKNLDIKDFSFRYLVVDEIWIPLSETLMIQRYRPVWNGLLEGFGNHDPGKGRHKGLCTIWDTMHPGRIWASRLIRRSEMITDIENKVSKYVGKTLSDSGEIEVKQ